MTVIPSQLCCIVSYNHFTFSQSFLFLMELMVITFLCSFCLLLLLFNCLTSHMNLITRHSGILGLDRLLSTPGISLHPRHPGNSISYLCGTFYVPEIIHLWDQLICLLPRSRSLPGLVLWIRVFPSPDFSTTLVPGGLSLSPQADRSIQLWREGGRERRKLSPSTTGRG